MAQPDVACYYPAPYWGWSESSWVKSLLLLFDRVAILLPDDMYGRHIAADFVSMGISGAAWAVIGKDPPGMVLAISGPVPQMVGTRERVNAYYLFAAQRQLGRASPTIS